MMKGFFPSILKKEVVSMLYVESNDYILNDSLEKIVLIYDIFTEKMFEKMFEEMLDE